MLKAFLSSMVFGLYVAFPIYVMVYDMSFKSKISVIPILIVGGILWLWFKAKDKVMKAKREMEQQNDTRSVKIEFYFAMKFFVIFVAIYTFLNVVNINFDTLTFKMELIGVSLILGWIFRSRKLQKFGI